MMSVQSLWDSEEQEGPEESCEKPDQRMNEQSIDRLRLVCVTV